MTSTSSQGKRASQMAAEHQEFLDRQPTTTKCAYCPWKFKGAAADGRLKAEEHRREKHPERAPGGKLAAAFEARKRRRKPWPKQEIVDAFARFEREHNRRATQADIPLCPYLPSLNTAQKVIGSWLRAGELGHAALSAPVAPAKPEATVDPPDPGGGGERPGGGETEGVPGEPQIRVRRLLHELADAIADCFEAA